MDQHQKEFFISAIEKVRRYVREDMVTLSSAECIFEDETKDPNSFLTLKELLPGLEPLYSYYSSNHSLLPVLLFPSILNFKTTAFKPRTGMLC
jgi:hypothetical protein